MSHHKMEPNKLISGKELIVKDNGFMQSAYNLDIIELRIIAMSIIMLRRNSSDLPRTNDSDERRAQIQKEFEKTALTPLTLHASLYADLFGTTLQNAYLVMQEGAERLSERKIKFSDAYVDKTTDKVYERLNNLRWTTMCSYIHGASAVQICFSPQIIPFLVHVDSNFTGYEIRNLVKLKTIYEFYMYELGVSWRNVGSCLIGRMDLRHKLGILDDTQLPRTSNFTRMLKTTLKTINENTDLNMSLEPVYSANGTGRKSIEKYKLAVTVKTTEERQALGWDNDFEAVYKSAGGKKTIKNVNKVDDAGTKPTKKLAEDKETAENANYKLVSKKPSGLKNAIYVSPDENGNWDYDLIVNNFNSPLLKITGMTYSTIPIELVNELISKEPNLIDKSKKLSPDLLIGHVKLVLSQKMTAMPAIQEKASKKASHNISNLTAQQKKEVLNNSAFRLKYSPVGESDSNVVKQALENMLNGDLSQITDLEKYL